MHTETDKVVSVNGECRAMDEYCRTALTAQARLCIACEVSQVMFVMLPLPQLQVTAWPAAPCYREAARRVWSAITVHGGAAMLQPTLLLLLPCCCCCCHAVLTHPMSHRVLPRRNFTMWQGVSLSMSPLPRVRAYSAMQDRTLHVIKLVWPRCGLHNACWVG
jgi:hypothetical protein